MRAVVINTKKRGWDALSQVPLIPAIDKNVLKELLLKVREVEQPDGWPTTHDLPTYYAVVWYGENGEFVLIRAADMASDGRLYPILHTSAIFRIEKQTSLVETGRFWSPRFIDQILSALT